MTKDSINLALEPRKETGKQVKNLRREGLVPVVIHNHGQDSILASGKYLELQRVYHKAGKHAPVDLSVGKNQHLALIKDVHIDPVRRDIRHIVFQAIRQDEKTEAEIPVHITGEVPAERIGLLLLKTLDHVEVEALPRDLPDAIEVDGSNLNEVGDRLTVADLKIPSGVTIHAEPDQVVAIVEEPKVHEEEPVVAEGEEGEEGAETAEGQEKEGEDKGEKAEAKKEPSEEE